MAFLYGHNVSRIRIIVHNIEVAYSIENEYYDNTKLPKQHPSAPSRQLLFRIPGILCSMLQQQLHYIMMCLCICHLERRLTLVVPSVNFCAAQEQQSYDVKIPPSGRHV